MLVFPHTPHALVVMKLPPGTRRHGDARRQGDVGDVAHPIVVARPQAVPSQSLIPVISPVAHDGLLTRNPAASSTSSPGVRMVRVSAVPFTLIPSGSSAASRSARAVADTRPAGESVTFTTRRRAVRPDNVPPLARFPSVSAYAGRA